MLVMGICAHDGLLSTQELEHIKYAYFGDCGDTAEFESLIDDFFGSSETLEHLLAQVADTGRALAVAEVAAAADGLDIRENLALMKCKSLLSGDRRA
jgi:hypothetical protein